MTDDGGRIAIVGLACRFPAAADAAQFWERLRAGEDCIRDLTQAELLAARPDRDPAAPGRVARWGVAPGVEDFDAAFFGFTNRQALATDPQQRLFLEIAHDALNDAGYGDAISRPLSGLFVAPGSSGYEAMVRGAPDLVRAVGEMSVEIGNAPEHIAACAAHRFDIQGPVVTIQTACSSSLVSVHAACQALLGHECDLAIAGGVALKLPQMAGYDYHPDAIASPDGRTRAFDVGAAGTVGGNGCGVLVLRRLEDARREGDDIRAVILGSAVNNDGARRAGYAAPSAQGQAEVMAAALAMADVEAGSIDYVECHGSGTPLGDAIELAALQHAYGVEREAPLLIGSVKSNIGHLREAAGVAGLIKTVLALQAGFVPPTLHFRRWNPQVGVDSQALSAVRQGTPWPGRDDRPPRASVSSFGLGGTNAHLILQQAPPRSPSPATSQAELLVLSARSESSLVEAAARLADHLEAARPPLADVAFTLRQGRCAHPHRLALVADPASAPRALRALRPATRAVRGRTRTAFLVAGTGDGYEGLGADLYAAEPRFRETVDLGFALARKHLERDLHDLTCIAKRREKPHGGDLRALVRAARGAGAKVEALSVVEQHCADFVVAYALAQLWRNAGLEPDALLGYSLGQYVAATVAEVFTLTDAVGLVAARARLIQRHDRGGLLTVCLPEAALAQRLPEGLTLAALNAPNLNVVGGPATLLDRFQHELVESGVVVRRLATRHAIHTPDLDSVATDLQAIVAALPRRAPKAALISNLTGTRLTATEVMDPTYWARHLTHPVRLADGVRSLIAEGYELFVEIGPGQTLSSIVHNLADGRALSAVQSLPAAHDGRDDRTVWLNGLGRAWEAGAIDKWQITRPAGVSRTSLPGEVWARRHYGLAPARPVANETLLAVGTSDPAPTRAQGAELTSRPPSATAAAVAALFAEMIGLETVTHEDNFFEIGGHSLLALQLLLRLQELFDRQLDLAMLYRNPTPFAIAAILEDTDGLQAEPSKAWTPSERA